MSIQRLSAFLSNQIELNINLHFEFHVAPQVKHSIQLTKDFIPFFAKQCILKCASSNIKYNDLDLINLIYKYGNMETDLDYTNLRSKDRWLWVLRAENHQCFYQRLPYLIFGRYIYLFKKVFQNNPDLKATVDRLLGLDFFKLIKIGICIHSIFYPKQEGFKISFRISNYTNTSIEKLKPLLTEENINIFMDIFSIAQEQFKEENIKYEINNKLLKKYEFNPLKRYPVIKTNSEDEDEKYIIPSLSDFIYACSEGMYYVLLDKLKEDDKEILFQALGDEFEKYIGDLIQFYNIPLFSCGKLFSEQVYKVCRNEVKSADWLLISDEYIFQIECKKRKLNNYAKAGIESEKKAGLGIYLESIAIELDKFTKKEEHIKDGKIDKIKYTNQIFVNVMVYLDEMFAINEYAREEIKSKMKIQKDNFYILGCYEFEKLCQYANDKNMSLKYALDDLINNRTETNKILFLHKVFNDFWDELY